MSLIDRHNQVLDKCVDSLKIWKELIAEYLDEEDKNQELEKLKRVTKEYCVLEDNFQKSMKVLQKVEEQLSAEGPAQEVQKLYDNQFKEESELSREDYTENEIWQKLFVGATDVIEVRQKKSKLDDAVFEELGDSLMCSNVFTPPIDPISKAVIRNPYKNKKCKHVYEHFTIVSYIKQQKRKAKCPYIGCRNNQLHMNDLVEDVPLQTQITQYIETQQDEESDESD